jgi:hypothetical protein
MALYLEDSLAGIDVLLRDSGWSHPIGAEAASRIGAFEVSAAPPGRHALDECAGIEAEWRRHYPALVRALVAPGECCLLLASGPIEEHCLPDLLPVIGWTAEVQGMYHIEGVTFAEPNGYTSSHIAFEFDEGVCRRMLATGVDLEWTRLSGLIASRAATRDALARRIWELPAEWLIQERALVLIPSSHFEGFAVVGERSRIELARRTMSEFILRST